MPTSIKNKFNFTLEQGGNDEVKRPCFSAKAKRGKKKYQKMEVMSLQRQTACILPCYIQ